MTTFKEMMKEEYEKSTLEDIMNYGCVGGFPGLTYYSDTTALYDSYEDEIWEKLYEEAEGMGYSCPLEMIASFNGAKDVATDSQFKNLLVWYMAEETAREIIENNEMMTNEEIVKGKGLEILDSNLEDRFLVTNSEDIYLIEFYEDGITGEKMVQEFKINETDPVNDIDGFDTANGIPDLQVTLEEWKEL